MSEITNSPKAWVLAARPKTLVGAAAPVIVGSSIAWRDALWPQIDRCMSTFHDHLGGSGITAFIKLVETDRVTQAYIMSFSIITALCLLFALLMQIDANFVNDLFDYRKGTDREDRLGPERACAQGWITPRAMAIGIGITTTQACMVGCLIMLWKLQWELLAVGILCVIFCFLYTTHLSYRGLGDVLVLVFFGIVPVGFTYYVTTGGEWTTGLTIAALGMGIATDNLLMINNYRDRYQDKVSGKRTIVVRLMKALGNKRGEKVSLHIYLYIGIMATILAVYGLWADYPSICSLNKLFRIGMLILYTCLHIRTYCKLRITDGKELNVLLGATSRNILIYSLCWV